MVKVERSFPAPESLAREAQKVNGSYCEADVVERLKRDFNDKCYICEMKKLQDPQVEHLLPHFNGKYSERKFDWNNLFWVCGHCNSVKNQRKYDMGIIDCCVEDPEEVLNFRLAKEQVDVVSRDKENEKAVLTAQLIMEVFHLKNSGMRVQKSAMRFKELNLEMNKLYDAIEELEKIPDSQFVQRKLHSLLKKESKFAAFKRNYVRENKDVFPQLIKYIE